MEKTINCADCGNAFTYTPNPNYKDNRKYCDSCGATRKAEFEGKPVDKDTGSPFRDFGDTIKPEVVKPGTASMEYKTKDNGYHLTPESCRAAALRCAIEWDDQKRFSYDQLIQMADKFNKYIVTGE